MEKLVAQVYKDYKANMTIKEIKAKYKFSFEELQAVFQEIHRLYSANIRQWKINQMSKEVRAQFRAWKRLNEYQGDDCGFKFND